MTLFTIDKITEKDAPRPATNAYRARRFQPYHPCPTVNDAAKFPTYFGDLTAPCPGPVTTTRVNCWDVCLNSTGGSPSSPEACSTVSSDTYSTVSSDGGSPEPDNCPSKVAEKSELKKADEEKPPFSYIALIAMAILASKEKRLLLCDIYQFIQENYPYYRNNDRSWRNSIRHNLSLNECFIKYGRSGDGRGNFWAIHPANVDDFSRGDFHRRRARRRVRASDMMLHSYPMYHPYAAPAAYSVPVAATPLGYVPMTVTTLPPYPVSPAVYPSAVYPPGQQYPPSTLGYPVPTLNHLQPFNVPIKNSTSPTSTTTDRRPPLESTTIDRISPTYHPVTVNPPSSYTSARPGYPYSPAQSRSPYRYHQTNHGLSYSSEYTYPSVSQAVVTSSMGSYQSSVSSSMPHFLH